MNKAQGCPICKSKRISLRFTIPTPFLERQYQYDIIACGNCGFHFSEGPDDDETLAKIYSGAFHNTGQQFARLERDGSFGVEATRSPVVINALDRALWLNERGLKGRLLDVGAGRGYFVKAADAYFDAEGLDLSDKAENYGRELNTQLHTGNFLTHDFAGQQYDVITLWDVLASMRDPIRVMQRIDELLASEGSLVMTLPRVSGLLPRLLGKHWPLWIPPVNLGFYSERSIELLLSRFGFTPRLMKCFGKRVAVSFLVTKLARTSGLKFVERAATLVPSQWRMALNLHDIITVVAAREGEVT